MGHVYRDKWEMQRFPLPPELDNILCFMYQQTAFETVHHWVSFSRCPKKDGMYSEENMCIKIYSKKQVNIFLTVNKTR
jgi:hypothetical protein